MRATFLLLFAALSALAAPAIAQDREVPYWASIRASELNMRVGPSADYKIAWVYHRAGLPVRVLRVMEGWRGPGWRKGLGGRAAVEPGSYRDRHRRIARRDAGGA